MGSSDILLVVLIKTATFSILGSIFMYIGEYDIHCAIVDLINRVLV